jgi:hypothetical protein
MESPSGNTHLLGVVSVSVTLYPASEMGCELVLTSSNQSVMLPLLKRTLLLSAKTSLIRICAERFAEHKRQAAAKRIRKPGKTILSKYPEPWLLQLTCASAAQILAIDQPCR